MSRGTSVFQATRSPAYVRRGGYCTSTVRAVTTVSIVNYFPRPATVAVIELGVYPQHGQSKLPVVAPQQLDSASMACHFFGFGLSATQLSDMTHALSSPHFFGQSSQQNSPLDLDSHPASTSIPLHKRCRIGTPVRSVPFPDVTIALARRYF